jgi:hypothetical protein
MPDFDWQSVIAISCVALAAAWGIRRGFRWASGDPLCGTGCGKCGDSHQAAEPEVVQLTRRTPGE